jgi:hypothetical protein
VKTPEKKSGKLDGGAGGIPVRSGVSTCTNSVDIAIVWKLGSTEGRPPQADDGGLGGVPHPTYTLPPRMGDRGLYRQYAYYDNAERGCKVASQG